MSEHRAHAAFFAPDPKELGLGICCVLHREGGQLSSERVADLLGDLLQVPEEPRNRIRHDDPHISEWMYYLRWACSDLRSDGFLARNAPGNWGMCSLTKHGHALGRWASLFYKGENCEMPDWVGAFLLPLQKRIRGLLDAKSRRKPPDYELCRWVRYCYWMNEPALAVAIFNLVLPDHVDAALYRQAERQARVLKLRAAEETGVVAEIANDAPAPTSIPGRPVVLCPNEGDGDDIAIETVRRRRRRRPRASSMREDLKRWVTETFPVGTSIPSLVRRTSNQVRAITDEGLVVVSSKTSREDLITWSTIQAVYRQLTETQYIDHRSIKNVATRSSFLCSLLAHLPGAQQVNGQCAVRLLDRSAILTDANQS